MASRGVKPAPRGKPSGLPWHSIFTDVAYQAGLKEPIICCLPNRVDYILETIGAGVVFFDYDSDGWLDIFLLSGTRLGEAPEQATNRLFRNNRDGTFTDVTKQAKLQGPQRWGTGCTWIDYDRDGNLDLFVSNYLVFDTKSIFGSRKTRSG
jgi:enediyne biosynthesis protein E4